MATTYKVKTSFKVWKKHLCSGCGGSFRYVFAREKEGTGSTEAAAQEAARKLAADALAKEVDNHPCPHCGTYQGPMVAALKNASYGCLFFLALLGAPVVLLILACTEVVSPGLCAWILAGCYATTFGAHARAASLKPNADRNRNLDLAQNALASGILVLDDRGTREPENLPGNGGVSGGAKVGIALALVALLAVPASELGRVGLGWPTNAGWYPPIAGPGDETYVYFDKEVSTIKGFWKGHATATVKNAAEVGVKSLPTSSSSDSWGGTIRAKSSEKGSKKTLWTKVHLPNDPKLVGKKLELALHVDAVYPHAEAGGFMERRESADLATSLTVAPDGAGKTWKLLFWGGFLGASAFFVIVSVVVSGSLARSEEGEPTQILPLEAPAG